MFPRLWKFIRNTKNREIISWFGGGIAVVAAGIWAVVVFFFLHQEKPATLSPTTVTQSGTGIGSGRDTNVNAPVSIGLDEQKARRPRSPVTQSLVGRRLEAQRAGGFMVIGRTPSTCAARRRYRAIG